MPAAQTGAAMPADRVDLIDEDDAGSVLLSLLEKVAHTRSAYADEHFNKVRSGNREERNVRFARDGSGQQCFACPGRSHQKDSFGDAPAQLLKFLRFL